MSRQYCLLFSLVITLLFPSALLAEVLVSKEAGSNFQKWEWSQSGVSFTLVQRSPDQTRAFFQARGFSSVDADVIGKACVFQTIFKNHAKKPLQYDMNDWQIKQGDLVLGLKTREVWDQYWDKVSAPKAARIAFRWSLLPTKQLFEPGDYNWGMSSYGLLPGESFDLSLSMELDGETITATIPQITCAPE